MGEMGCDFCLIQNELGHLGVDSAHRLVSHQVEELRTRLLSLLRAASACTLRSAATAAATAAAAATGAMMPSDLARARRCTVGSRRLELATAATAAQPRHSRRWLLLGGASKCCG